MYRAASYVLSGAGFEHYEISNFAKPGHRHGHLCAATLRALLPGITPSDVHTVTQIILRRPAQWRQNAWSADSIG